MQSSILRFPDVLAQTGLSRSSIYNRINQGLWPRPVKLGIRAIGWPSHEVEAINAAVIAGLTITEIQALVEMLEADRSGVSLIDQITTNDFGGGHE